MAKAPRLAGTCYFKVDGEQLELSGKVEVPLTSKTRTALPSHTGVAGFKEEHRTPYIKATLFIPENFPRKKLDEMEEGSVTVELANGMVHTLSGAFVVGEPSYDSEAGTAEYEFNGLKGVWH
ncbi:MAG: phage tail tube protein [Sulfuritalea sp.]|jgi:hypothetical protein|nr:phage tail tube protein [Sulfuritalea sp.]